jgi:hypothetical protein
LWRPSGRLTAETIRVEIDLVSVGVEKRDRLLELHSDVAPGSPFASVM